MINWIKLKSNCTLYLEDIFTEIQQIKFLIITNMVSWPKKVPNITDKYYMMWTTNKSSHITLYDCMDFLVYNLM